jgi:serine/threonine-protein kinase
MADESTSPPSGGQPVPRFPDGHYAIDGVLGTGGMAVVYRARDLRHGRTVALKVLRADIAQAVGTERFLREIAVTASFSHPHILPLLDSGVTADDAGRAIPYYVTPLIEGESLAVRLRARHRLPAPEAVRLAGEILEALRYAHEHGVIHRDVKPANVLLSGGHAVVADFGVARPLRTSGAAVQPESMTASGMVLGTPAYMSPEQALGDTDVDARCDLYAVGCVLYEMLAGVNPFDTPTPHGVLSRKISGGYVPLSRLRPGLPPTLDTVIARALEPEPSDRFGSADEFLAELTRLDVRPSASAQASHATAAPVTPAPAPTRATWIAAAGASLLFLATAAWLAGRMPGVDAGAAPDAAAPTGTPALDKARIAVLPPEVAGGDSLVASTLHADLIDELARYPALTVISRNGVIGLSGAAARVDSVARVLGTGSLITSQVRGDGDSVWVTVRLVDGSTSAQVASHVAAGRRRDVLAVRSAMVDSVTTFLRRQIGVGLQRQRERGATNADAWELVARAQLTSQAVADARDERVFREVDALLAEAQSLDPAWVQPVARRVALRTNWAAVVQARDALARGSKAPTQWLREAIALADASLARFGTSADLRYERGRALMELWIGSAPDAPEALREAAETDLTFAVQQRGDLAMGWYHLSQLREQRGDFAGAREAAERARKADAWLQNDAALVSRLLFASLALGDAESARAWCRTGLEQYPDRSHFWGCALNVLAWTATNAGDVEAAWRALDDAATRDRTGVLTAFSGQQRLLVAAVAARTGLADSARAIMERVRSEAAAPMAGPGLDLNQAYVHTLLGETTSALDHIERFLAAMPASRGYVRRLPWFDALADQPRFQRLVGSP